MPIASSQRTVIDCPDPGVLARFYGAVLGWEVGVRDDGAWAGIWSPDRHHSMRFQRVEGYRPPDWPGQNSPQQMHVDLRVTDLDAAESAVLALDPPAIKAEEQPGGGYRVFLDPAGHPFCLTTNA